MAIELRQPKPQTVKLSDSEVMFATWIGEQRMHIVNERNLQVPDGQPKDQSSQSKQHILGALSECAVAKFSGRYWQANIDGPDDGGDVGELAVRSTDRDVKTDPRLILLPRDNPSRIVVFVIAQSPYFSIRGWAEGESFRNEQFWADPTGRNFWAWFVPNEYLFDPEVLKVGHVYYEQVIREQPKMRQHRMRPVMPGGANGVSTKR